MTATQRTAFVAAVLFSLALVAIAQDPPKPIPIRKIGVKKGEPKAEEPSRDKPAPEASPARTEGGVVLRVYEWGVATANWDGTEEAPEDLPAFYYAADQIPIELPPPKPQPGNKPAVIRKPVLYIACEQDVTFDLDVRFTRGDLTWMYPRANRRIDASTAQWDSIQLYADGVKREKSLALPALGAAKQGHWTEFSREGATASIVVNGEHERFLFYEGTDTGLPEIDVFLDAEGKLVIRNYTAHDMLDVRAHLKVNGEAVRIKAERIPAASGDTPGEIRLEAVSAAGFGEAGVLAQECQAAGLTEEQARVFERCWKAELLELAGTVSWRRTQKALDELMPLKFTLPEGISTEVKRVGYAQVRGIDLSRTTALDALVKDYLAGNKEALKDLKGTAGAGALRRAMHDESRPLNERVTLAKALAHAK
jgi:hypothetical protein